MMQTVPVLPTVVSIGIQSNSLDLSSLSEDQRTQLTLAVAQFRASQRRIESEFISLSAQLAMMKSILGPQFMSFVKSEFDLPPHTVRRYLALNECMTKHLSTDGRIDVAQVQQFSQGALRMLLGVTDDDVIAEVRQLAQNGQKINESVINRLIEARNVDYEERLALAEAETIAATQKLAATNEQRERETGRLRAHVERQDELLRRQNERVQALEEDVSRLSKQATVITEKEVLREVLPPGFESAQEAKATVEAELLARRRELETETARAAELKRANDELYASIESFKEDSVEFIRIKALVEEILTELPKSRLQVLSSRDTKMKEALKSMGEALMQFGGELVAASNAA